MTTPKRTFRELRNPIRLLILLAAFAAAAGCSTSQSTNGDKAIVNHILPSGSSVAGWLVTPSGGTHASSATLDYIGNGGSSDCAQCHGSDLDGGISKVSCVDNPAGCHHGPVPNWTSPTVHGATAKKAPGSSGFASCQICHGSDFRTVRGGVTCFTCHTTAPHAPRPWRSSTGSTHTDTNTANAPVCYTCHAYSVPQNPRNPHQPPFPAPAGTAPGCFNGTMCHNQAGAPHPKGNPAWYATPPAAQVHGNGAKATPSSTAGFAYCQICHGSGTNFSGGPSGVSCYPCHVANAPHPSQWRTGDTYVHTSTASGNAAVCAYCHAGGANSPIPPPPAPTPGAPPDCFNNTLCHGPGGAPHPVPYNDTSHYTVSQAGFNSTCINCHDISAPSTKVGPVCQSCHVAASPLAALNCTSCHASPPNSGAPAGAAYPNIAGTHNVHLAQNSTGSPVSCGTCHTGLTSGTLNHYNLAKTRVAPGNVAFLATYNAKTGASSFTPGSFTCANVSCHGGTSPNWRTGVIDVNVNCTICHAYGSSQFNSYSSGPGPGSEAGPHHTGAASCVDCHNTGSLAVNHFTTLSTAAMEGPASGTIGGGSTSIPAGEYNPVTKSCNPSCHGSQTW